LQSGYFVNELVEIVGQRGLNGDRLFTAGVEKIDAEGMQHQAAGDFHSIGKGNVALPFN
jgi:hypothetical protein